MKRNICILFFALIGVSSFGEAFEITDEFVQYIKKATNPYEFGLRADGKFYPYSTRYGRRIGYRQIVADKKMYREGWSRDAAEARLRKDLQTVLKQLIEYVDRRYPETPFNRLSFQSRHILLDFAYSEGVERISPEFYQTVIAQDWDRLIRTHLYIRMTDGWPDQIQNKAFADQWIYSANPLVKFSERAKNAAD